MNRGTTRMIFGLVLIIIQIVSVLGHMGSPDSIPLGEMSFSYMIGYFSFGIVGVILLVWGITARIKKNKQDRPE